MKRKIIYIITLLMITLAVFAQPSIYMDAQSLVTGTWASASGGTATIQEEIGQNPFEGDTNYRFDYDFTAWWAGCGLNLDNWGTTSARDFSGYTHLRLAYYGLSMGSELNVKLKNGSDSGNTIVIGGAIPGYQVIDIPMPLLVNGSTMTANAVTEIEFSISGVESANNSVFLDAIELVNLDDVAQSASATTWALANYARLGVNLANWLDAYWLIPFNTFPEVNLYNRTNIQAFKNAGFEVIRMPISFERITPTTAPYTVDFNHQALQLVDSMIVWAADFDLKLIIDNHHGYELTDANYLNEIPRLKAIWAQLAARYGDLDNSRYLFEVYNEPVEISNINFRTLSQAIVDTIRQTESQIHSIIVGASGYNSGSNLAAFLPLNDEDIIYTFHSYDPFLFTHQGMSWTTPANFPARLFPQTGEVDAINSLFTTVKNWSDANDVPVWLGEYGVSSEADDTSRCSWIETMVNAAEVNGFVHFYWDAIHSSDAFGFFNNGTVSEPTTTPCFKNAMDLFTSPLAVNFLDVHSQCDGDALQIEWRIETSDEWYIFILERSNDGIYWHETEENLVREELNIFSVNNAISGDFYRVKTIDAAGIGKYSSIVHASCLGAKGILIAYPNPAQEQLSLLWKYSNLRLVSANLYNSSGQKVKSLLAQSTSLTIDTRDLPGGLYTLHAVLSNGNIKRKQIVVMHK